jgi:hypothetical protein
MPPLTGLYHFTGDVLQLCRTYGAALRVADRFLNAKAQSRQDAKQAVVSLRLCTFAPLR